MPGELWGERAIEMYSDQQDDYYYGGGYGPGDGQQYYNPNVGYGNYGQAYAPPPQAGGPGRQPPPGQQQQQQNFYQPNMGMGGMDPLVANFAKQYGENLMEQGKEKLDQKFAYFLSSSKLKYYFAVDTTYVLKKMGLLFFPFTHKVSARIGCAVQRGINLCLCYVTIFLWFYRSGH